MLYEIQSRWLLAIILVTVPTCLMAQQATEHPEFRVLVGSKISFNGLGMHYKFERVDDLGFGYDLMSLIQYGSVRDGLNLTKEQKTEITRHYEERQKVLIKAVTENLSQIDDSKGHLKKIFLDYEADMMATLTSDQLDRLESLRFFAELEQIGMERFLTGKLMREKFGLTDDEAEGVNARSEELETKRNALSANLNLEANRKLVARLHDSEKARFDAVFESEKFRKLFLEENLFQSPRDMRRPRKSRIDQIRLLKLASIRKQLSVEPDQFSEIKSLDADDKISDKASRLAEILDSRQMEKLQQIAIEKELDKSGTVASLTHGFLAKKIGVSGEHAQELFELGVELEKALKNERRLRKRELALQSLDGLSPNKRKQIVELFDRLSP